ncbi:hypothetical protein ACROYT_G036540 [Oculina patagonica]
MDLKRSSDICSFYGCRRTIFQMKLTVLIGFALVLHTTCYSVSEQNDRSYENFRKQKRAAVLYRGHLWRATYDKNREVTKVFIPYTVRTGGWFSGLDNYDKQTIREAANVIAKHTCIRFIQRTNQKDYIEFYEDSNNICKSHISKKGGKQLLSLGSGCKNRGHVTHELMHALGFFHEHTRPDRDKFVKILWNNIKSDHLQQIEIRKRGEVTTLGQPYDFQSIMHYSNKEFSKNGRDTIQAISDPSMPLGNVNSLSAVDVMQINLLYNCPEALKQVDNYKVTVYTGNKYMAGTDAKVFVELFGQNHGQEQNSGEVELAGNKNAFEMGGFDTFNVISPNLGKLSKLTIRLSNGGYSGGWYLSKVRVQNRKKQVDVTFSCFCWLSGRLDTKTLEAF